MKNTLLTFSLTLLTGVIAQAAGIPIPPGLNAGDTYQLIFVTAASFTALSSDIEDYNTDVQNEAALNADLLAFDAWYGVTWHAIGSTSAVASTVNAPSTGRVYTLDGILVTLIGMYSDAL